MEICFLIILGLVQGVCEFLPLSSSGHLVLFSKWFGIEDSLFVSIFLHLATLLSIVIVLRKEVFSLIRHPFSDKSMKLYIATIPTCIIALIFLPIVKKSFSGDFLPFAFLITALLLFIVWKNRDKKQNKDFSIKNAIIMGIAQGLAVFPGISRSGATISAGILSGGDRQECAKFSFIMSIPIIILSMLMEIFDLCRGQEVLSVNITGLILSFIVAFIVGILSIKFMVKAIEKNSFLLMSIYLIVISIISIF